MLDELRLPLTAFVEGQLFERAAAGLCALLVERGVDVQLHVYDHATSGDTPESLTPGRRRVHGSSWDARPTAIARTPAG